MLTADAVRNKTTLTHLALTDYTGNEKYGVLNE